ncbi:hypothetical protein [Streptomyces formicae]|uniref:Uncharacterized protein n=1 Tax=Streptomyces formicae TaxID=1616117 RepID=A0ABY3WTR5_9ACTN|nr:hypothetical protein [Streptomyces formicae]UNM13178.1 hypothetical protein J4032_18260 [Streptomyces formicae]
MATSPLLSYSYATSPNSLTGGGTGKLSLTATNTTGKSIPSFQEIAYTLPIGTKATDLAAIAPTQSQINVSGSNIRNWSFTLSKSESSCKVTLKPTIQTFQVGEYVTVTISVTVNTATGTASVTASERSSSQTKDIPDFPIFKREEGFTFAGFHPEPVAVTVGGTTTLKWDGEKIDGYTLTYDDQTIPLSGTTRFYQVPHLTHPTAFALEAHPENPTPNTPPPTLTTTVDVTNPDLNVGNLTTTGTTQLHKAKALNEERYEIDLLGPPEQVTERDKVEYAAFCSKGIPVKFSGDGLAWIEVQYCYYWSPGDKYSTPLELEVSTNYGAYRETLREGNRSSPIIIRDNNALVLKLAGAPKQFSTVVLGVKLTWWGLGLSSTISSTPLAEFPNLAIFLLSRLVTSENGREVENVVKTNIYDLARVAPHGKRALVEAPEREYSFRSFRPVPVVVDFDGTTTLKWDGNEIRDYTLTYDDQVIPLAGAAVSHEVPHLTHPTAFALEAHPQNPTPGTPPPTLTTSVDVTNPNLTMRDLTATGTMQFQRMQDAINMHKYRITASIFPVGADFRNFGDNANVFNKIPIRLTGDGVVRIFYHFAFTYLNGGNRDLNMVVAVGDKQFELDKWEYSRPLPITAGDVLTIIIPEKDRYYETVGRVVIDLDWYGLGRESKKLEKPENPFPLPGCSQWSCDGW